MQHKGYVRVRVGVLLLPLALGAESL